MKKRITTILTLALIIIMIVGCGQSVKKDENGTFYNEKYNDKQMVTVDKEKIKLTDDVVVCKTSGFGFVKPKAWKDVKNQDGIDGYAAEPEAYYTMYMPEEQVKKIKSINKDTMSKEEISNIKKEAYASEFYLFAIYRINKDDEMTSKDAKELEKDFKEVKKIGSIDKDTFYIAYNDKVPETGFTSSEKGDIKKMIGTIKDIEKNIILFPPTDPMDDFNASMSKFKTTDLDGNKIDESIFKDYDVTMVNVWATWCKYCIQEMPEIQKLYEELPENTNIITICTDGDKEKDTAKAVLDKVGAKFTTINSSEDINKNVIEYVKGFPTTFFVDKNGKVIGKLQIGTPAEEGKNKDAYLKLIEEAKKDVNKEDGK